MTDSATAQRQRATVAIGDYELGPQIGRGSFATVYRGVNKVTTSKRVFMHSSQPPLF
ncbi:hypothetical protein FBU59_000958 [Linderina macrospora]|uniref:Uncharacterized protein n=1 Tax=Linderina macrospora TaxID=4868 RepID=A0ACC1JFF4_9FUNG|nr:hypothetical protein FBU59_000958 [Linderina macrospora]